MTVTMHYIETIEHEGQTYIRLDAVMAILEAKLHAAPNVLDRAKLELLTAIEQARHARRPL